MAVLERKLLDPLPLRSRLGHGNPAHPLDGAQRGRGLLAGGDQERRRDQGGSADPLAAARVINYGTCVAK